MTAGVARFGWVLAFSAIACGRARAEDLPLAANAPPAPPSAAPDAPLPAASAEPAPLGVPDAGRAPDALPCPGGRAACEREHPVVARGVLTRAEAYLASCRHCRHRGVVTATVRRMRAIAEKDRRARQRREPADCQSSLDAAILVSPDSVVAGDRPRVIVASDRPLSATLEVSSEAGRALSFSERERGGGPPWYRVIALDGVETGAHRVVLREGSSVVACQRFTVSKRRQGRQRGGHAVWKSGRGWDRGTENLYSAFIASTFDASEGKRWKGIAAVLGDATRNFLFDHFAQGEDSDPARLALRPDCADAPYVMRAYFAWKLGLPFGYHRRGTGQGDSLEPEREWVTNETPLGAEAEPAPRAPRLASPAELRDFADTLLGDVTARSLRTAPSDDETDLYPVALRREHLRPGVVFADPYGHTLTLVKWLPQAQGRPGQLLAVDAQPDGTVGIRRFWRGNFLFVDQQAPRGFGFKAFRPIVRDRGKARLLNNDELGVADGYGGFSLEQSRLGASDFYARMSRLISPEPPPPALELGELVSALVAQLERRVAEVAVADELVGARKTPIEMPEGRAMFLGVGAWEAASTPCRDLRLLVGMDSVLAFPEEAARAESAPARAEALRRELETLLGQRAASSAVEYLRSDGTKQRLTLAELLARRARFEMAYNPNDCPELRWGATEGSDELKSCGRRAPAVQKRNMERMRHWFAKRYSCG